MRAHPKARFGRPPPAPSPRTRVRWSVHVGEGGPISSWRGACRMDRPPVETTKRIAADNGVARASCECYRCGSPDLARSNGAACFAEQDQNSHALPGRSTAVCAPPGSIATRQKQIASRTPQRLRPANKEGGAGSGFLSPLFRSGALGVVSFGMLSPRWNFVPCVGVWRRFSTTSAPERSGIFVGAGRFGLDVAVMSAIPSDWETSRKRDGASAKASKAD